MYAQFFGLSQEPFSIAPDPRYLFMSERHREALAHLLYGLGGGGGFVLLSGEIGAGKTTVCRCFLEQIPKRCNVAYIFNPKLTATELLKSVCDEFGVPPTDVSAAAATVKDYLDPLNEFLLRTHAVGQNNVLIIDEAQNLSAEVLEQLRLLTNLETNERKLLQIILIGQPELRSMLARPELEQLAQRVIARFHLEALSDDETDQYIRHRLSVAGLQGPVPFDAKATQRIHQLARGVPRRINLICDRALLGAYATNTHVVDRGIVDKAAAEVFDAGELAQPAKGMRAKATLLGAGVVVGAALFGVANWLGSKQTGGSLTASATALSKASARSASSTDKTAASPPRASSAAERGVAASKAASAPMNLSAADLATGFKTLTRDEKQAWRDLAPAWKLTLDAGDPCTASQARQVQCFRSSGSTLALIRQLDRPGIVTLRDADDKPVYALLTGLSGRSATLRIGDTSRTVSLQSLANLWRGDFATFWRMPPDYAGGVVNAASGPVADWLVAKLDRVQPGQPVAAIASAAARGDASEQTLRARVASFQLAEGLKPDGRAGPTTFMQLNRATGVDEPHLVSDALPN